MPSQMKISQAGLTAGVAGKARTDGLSTGALVTLENVGPQGVTSFRLLWGPPDDTTAVASLAVTGNPNIWTFTPTVGVHDTYLIELREDGIPIERRIFAVRTVNNHLRVPAFNEQASRHASLDNHGADQVALSDDNATDYSDATLNTLNYTGYWRSLRELYRVVEAGTGGLADHGVPYIKLPSAAAAPSVIGATVNGNLVELPLSTSITTASGQVQRAALTGAIVAAINANTTKFGGILDSGVAENDRTNLNFLNGTHVLLTVNDDAGNDELEITATLAAAAAKSVLVNATNGSAVPAYLAGTAAGSYLRVNPSNNNLEWAAVVPPGVAVANVTITQATAQPIVSYAAPANAWAVGTTYRFYAHVLYVHTAELTADPTFQIQNNGVVAASVTLQIPATAGTYLLRVEGCLTCRTTGAGGTLVASISVDASGPAGVGATLPEVSGSITTATTALDTTAIATIRLTGHLGAVVGGNTMTTPNAYITPVL